MNSRSSNSVGFVTIILLILGACAGGVPGLDASSPRESKAAGTGADRTHWRTLPVKDQAQHARSLQRALETAEQDIIRWRGDAAEGEIQIQATTDLSHSIVCRQFADLVVVGSIEHSRTDHACWIGSAWVYLEHGLAKPVIAPAFFDKDRVYVTRSRTTLKRVARRTGASLAELKRLNPMARGRLASGTKIIVP